jgi:hypothetical protein
MTATLYIHRTAADLQQAQLTALEARGLMPRMIRQAQITQALSALVLGVCMAIVADDMLLLTLGAVLAVILPLLLPRQMRRSTQRRISTEVAHLGACLGPRTLLAGDAGLSDLGNGLSTTVGWSAITRLIATPERYVVLADMAAAIDIPRRGDLATVDAFAAEIGRRVQAARASDLVGAH